MAEANLNANGRCDSKCIANQIGTQGRNFWGEGGRAVSMVIFFVNSPLALVLPSLPTSSISLLSQTFGTECKLVLIIL